MICRKLAKRDWLFKMSNYGGHNVSQGFNARGIKFLRTKGSIDRKHAFIQSRQETGKRRRSHIHSYAICLGMSLLSLFSQHDKGTFDTNNCKSTSYDQYRMFMCVCHHLTTRTGRKKQRPVRKADLNTRTRIDQFRARIH